MELTRNVMRFALATYFMKHGKGTTHVFEPRDVSATSLLHGPRVAFSDEEELNPEFTDFVVTSVWTLEQFMLEERFQDWSNGVTELREYVMTHGLVVQLVALLVKQLKEQKQQSACIVQVMEHMCFENTGEPSEVCDQMVKCLLVAKDHCWQNTDPEVAGWLNQAIDNITNGVRQYEEQNQDLQYETSRLTAREQIV